MTLAHSVTPLIQSLKGSYNYTGHVNMHGGCFKWVLKINFQGGVKKNPLLLVNLYYQLMEGGILHECGYSRVAECTTLTGCSSLTSYYVSRYN